VADGHEHTVDRQLRRLAGDQVAQHDAGDLALAFVGDALDGAVPTPVDLRVRQRAIGHRLRRTQRVAAVHDGDRRGKARQVERLFHRGVSPADDRNRPAAEEEAVAGGAGRHTVPHQ
jgi:hypothetical protein